MKGTYYLDTLLKKISGKIQKLKPSSSWGFKAQASGGGATEATVSLAYLQKKGVTEKVTELSYSYALAH